MTRPPLELLLEALVDFRMDHPHIESAALDRAEAQVEALRAQAEPPRVVDIEIIPDYNAPAWVRVIRYSWPVTQEEIEELGAQVALDELPSAGRWRVPVANTGQTNADGRQWLEYQFDDRAALAQADAGGDS